MGNQANAQFNIQLDGLDAALRVLNESMRTLKEIDPGMARSMNSALRFEAKQVAQGFADATLEPLIRAHGGPQGPAMSKTLRAKSDRIPIVAIGAVNPRGLSGWKGAAKAKKARQRGRNIPPAKWKGALAFGVEYGPRPQREPNPYGRRRPRNDGGYVLGPRADMLARELLPRYQHLLVWALDRAGWRMREAG
jgi:hypothetical protein